MVTLKKIVGQIVSSTFPFKETHLYTVLPPLQGFIQALTDLRLPEVKT